MTGYSPVDWHRRFVQQASWTESVRAYLLSRLGRADRILEIGSGTGAVAATLRGYTKNAYGVDIAFEPLRFARRRDPDTRLACGDALRLPFPADIFDAVTCHFLLLWVPNAAQALAEMRRVARPGGAVIAFAEPDYGARIDYPPALEPLGKLQAEALRRQGAEPNMGRRISELFHAAGLTSIETGVLGGQWQGAPSPEQLDSEWETLQADLEGIIPPGELEALRRIDEQAWQRGQRVLFVPTFYAIGWKPIDQP